MYNWLYLFNNIKLLPGYKVGIAISYYSSPGIPLTFPLQPLQYIGISDASYGNASLEIGRSYIGSYTLPKNVFSVDSNYPTFLISSADFQNLYGLNLIQLNGSGDYGGVGGYDPITENFNPRVGDEIRFNQNESISLTIIRVEEELSLQRVVFELNRALTSAEIAIVNGSSEGFLIRRNTVDPSKLVINAPKLVGGAPGYLTPQYISPDLIASLDKTVETLKETGIL